MERTSNSHARGHDPSVGSRLSDQWRVIYRVVSDCLTYYTESVTPHDYRRR
jgi:hypothetical protein